MTDQWYFEIGDGQTYGPFSLEKLRKWAASGNLMPTHRVRRADSTEWTIAAYVPGLELTTADTAVVPPVAEDTEDANRGKLGSLIQKLTRKGGRGKADGSEDHQADIVEICDELMEIAFERGASDIHIDPEENIVLIQLRVDGVLETLRKLPKSIHARDHQPLQSAFAHGYRRAAHGTGRTILPMPGAAAAADSYSGRHRCRQRMASE